ncbi:hypothetical protein [Nonomuraea turcica]|uniref:hypothetical protein n=1 Tax=Nonomuraea sp. G32 TaxID=3067274 RepID=UPI00273C6564|nr:hypothetical protein [Nonomuraea sp. G32]MDP4504908.1 hypothetical protein [Nonomuraea sp. G32]
MTSDRQARDGIEDRVARPSSGALSSALPAALAATIQQVLMLDEVTGCGRAGKKLACLGMRAGVRDPVVR